MRLHRFFVEEKLENKKEFVTDNPELIHQWKNVFRLRSGEKVILLDNSGYEFYGTIELTSKERTVVIIDEVKENNLIKNKPSLEVYLYVALIKKDNFEWILEKGTEIGVTGFVPIVSERSEKKNLNHERAFKIIREASEQSGRGILPTLGEVVSLEDLLLKEDVHFVVFHLEGKPFVKKDFINDKRLGVLIGPEGGWTDQEIALFKEKNIPIVRLGNQTLRAETAAITVSSLLLLG